MANVNAPFGLKPVKHMNGSAWNGAVNLYYIPQADTNAYFVGDAVVSAANGNLLNGASAVALAGTRGAAMIAGNIRGVIVGVGTSVATPGGASPQAFDPSNLESISIPATKTKDYYVWVVDSPDVVFEAQVNTIANTAFNKNAPLFVGVAPASALAKSSSYVQASVAAVTQALPLKIVGAPFRIDNELDSPGTNAKVFVIINQHELAGNTVGI